MDHMGWFQNIFLSVPWWVSYKIVGHSSSCRTKPFAGVNIKIVSPFRLLCIFPIFWVSFYHELHQEHSIDFHDYVIIVVGVEESAWYANCYNFLHLLSIDSHSHKYRFKRNSRRRCFFFCYMLPLDTPIGTRPHLDFAILLLNQENEGC